MSLKYESMSLKYESMGLKYESMRLKYESMSLKYESIRLLLEHFHQPAAERDRNNNNKTIIHRPYGRQYRRDMGGLVG